MARKPTLEPRVKRLEDGQQRLETMVGETRAEMRNVLIEVEGHVTKSVRAAFDPHVEVMTAARDEWQKARLRKEQEEEEAKKRAAEREERQHKMDKWKLRATIIGAILTAIGGTAALIKGLE